MWIKQHKGGLIDQVGWLGLRVGSRLELRVHWSNKSGELLY